MRPEINRFNQEAVKYTSVEFPKTTEGKLNAILLSVNSEYKSATLGWFLDKNFRTKNEIKDISKIYLNSSVKNLNAATYKDYCTYTFIPIGAVAEEKIKSKGRTYSFSHYKLTPDGEKYAKPIAQFALKTAVEIGISMHEIFGNTATPGETGSPYNTARILLELEKEDNIRNLEIANRLGLDQGVVADQISRLKKIGFCSHESIHSEITGSSKYERACEETPEGIAWNSTRLGSGKKSVTSLTEKGREFVQEFLIPVHQALKKDDLSAINKEIEILKDISVAQSYITRGFKLYENVSAYSKSKSKDENLSAVLRLLKNKEMSHKEVSEELGNKATLYLHILSERGEIISKKEGKKVIYSLNPQN